MSSTEMYQAGLKGEVRDGNTNLEVIIIWRALKFMKLDERIKCLCLEEDQILNFGK